MEVHHHPHVEKKNFKEYGKVFFIFLLILFFYQAFPQNMHNDDVATIKSDRAASNEAIAKHDVNGISKFWLDDFVQVIGRGTYEIGKENIAALWKELFLLRIVFFFPLHIVSLQVQCAIAKGLCVFS